MNHVYVVKETVIENKKDGNVVNEIDAVLASSKTKLAKMGGMSAQKFVDYDFGAMTETKDVKENLRDILDEEVEKNFAIESLYNQIIWVDLREMALEPETVTLLPKESGVLLEKYLVQGNLNAILFLNAMALTASRKELVDATVGLKEIESYQKSYQLFVFRFFKVSQFWSNMADLTRIAIRLIMSLLISDCRALRWKQVNLFLSSAVQRICSIAGLRLLRRYKVEVTEV